MCPARPARRLGRVPAGVLAVIGMSLLAACGVPSAGAEPEVALTASPVETGAAPVDDLDDPGTSAAPASSTTTDTESVGSTTSVRASSTTTDTVGELELTGRGGDALVSDPDATTAIPSSPDPTTTTTTTTTTTSTLPPPPTTTSCGAVTVIGDSTAVGLDGSTGVIAPADGIVQRLHDVGVVDVRLEVSGGRSIVEKLDGQENGAEVARRVAASGFVGCWVVLLGTNDAANIAAGAGLGVADRVGRVLDAIGGQPVVWVNAATITDTGHWARANMAAWNAQLGGVIGERFGVGLGDWYGFAQPGWFGSDGIHPNGVGLVERAKFVADLLLWYFPAR